MQKASIRSQCHCNESKLRWQAETIKPLASPERWEHNIKDRTVLALANLPEHHFTSVTLACLDTSSPRAEINADKLVLEKNLQSTLNCLQKWCLENGMILNIDKTKAMLIASRQKRTVLGDTVLNLQYNDIAMWYCYPGKAAI